MIPLRGALWTLGAAVAVFLLGWGVLAYGRHESAKEAQWKGQLEAAHADTKAAQALALRADTVYRQGETVYLRGRDALLNPPKGSPPASIEVKACFALSDDLKSKCDARHDADTAATHKVERELAVQKEKPSGVPRVQAFGEAMYDVAHAVPVIRAGATARVIGPISLSVAGEFAAPRVGESKPAFRALVGARVNF